MRIAFAYDLCYPHTIGGGEKRNHELAKHLVRLGHEVDILTMHFWKHPGICHRDGIRYIPVAPYVPPFNARGKRSLDEPWSYGCGLAGYLQLHCNDYDAIEYAAFPYLHILFTRLRARTLHPKTIICWFEARGMQGWFRYQGLRGVPAALMEFLVARSANHHVAISEHAARRLSRRLRVPEDRITTIPCGIPDDWIRTQDTDRNNIATRRNLLFVGRLEPHKQADVAVRTLGALNRRDYCLHIVGSGSEQGKLERLSAKLHVESQVVFHSALSETQLLCLYDNARAFLFPSRMEGFGIAALEAMSRGVPVVTLDCSESAVPELLKAGGGFTVKDEEAFAAATKRLMLDDCLLHQCSREALDVAQRFTWNTIARRTAAYIEHLK